MDSTIEKYAMEVDVSQIQPFERVRALLGFYTSEASRALVDAGIWRSHRNRLKRAIDERTASLTAQAKSSTAWRTKAIVRDDKKIAKWSREIEECESVIELLDRLEKTYDRYAFTLSREMTARTGDRERYYGRGGGATP